MSRTTLRDLSELPLGKIHKLIIEHAKMVEAYYRPWTVRFRPVALDGLTRAVKALKMKEARRVRTRVRQRRKSAASSSR